MSIRLEILKVGFDQRGDADFSVNAAVMNLSYENINALRAMVSVAIGQMERMWNDAQMLKPENIGSKDGA